MMQISSAVIVVILQPTCNKNTGIVSPIKLHCCLHITGVSCKVQLRSKDFRAKTGQERTCFKKRLCWLGHVPWMDHQFCIILRGYSVQERTMSTKNKRRTHSEKEMQLDKGKGCFHMHMTMLNSHLKHQSDVCSSNLLLA